MTVVQKAGSMVENSVEKKGALTVALKDLRWVEKKVGL
jgi:hypothetical protein